LDGLAERVVEVLSREPKLNPAIRQEFLVEVEVQLVAHHAVKLPKVHDIDLPIPREREKLAPRWPIVGGSGYCVEKDVGVSDNAAVAVDGGPLGFLKLNVGTITLALVVR
jgi:hypothetical protein